jgi:hypothetical protein
VITYEVFVSVVVVVVVVVCILLNPSACCIQFPDSSPVHIFASTVVVVVVFVEVHPPQSLSLCIHSSLQCSLMSAVVVVAID